MSDKACTYQGLREEALVAFVYDELAPEERRAFEAHLPGCAECRTELAGLGVARGQLQRWLPPDRDAAFVAAGFRAAATRTSRWTVLREIPVWAQIAAAMLIVGVAAGLANLRITVGPAGVSLRTGWSVSDGSVDMGGSAATSNLASRQDLAALETVLRAEIEAASIPAASPAPSADFAAERQEIMRNVQALVATREQEQRRDIALQIAEMYRTVQSQRQGDLAKIDKVLDTREYLLRRDALYQQRQLNAITQQVTQRR